MEGGETGGYHSEAAISTLLRLLFGEMRRQDIENGRGAICFITCFFLLHASNTTNIRGKAPFFGVALMFVPDSKSNRSNLPKVPNLELIAMALITCTGPGPG
jgi:hypothetical protein